MICIWICSVDRVNILNNVCDFGGVCYSQCMAWFCLAWLGSVLSKFWSAFIFHAILSTTWVTDTCKIEIRIFSAFISQAIQNVLKFFKNIRWILFTRRRFYALISQVVTWNGTHFRTVHTMFKNTNCKFLRLSWWFAKWPKWETRVESSRSTSVHGS